VCSLVESCSVVVFSLVESCANLWTVVGPVLSSPLSGAGETMSHIRTVLVKFNGWRRVELCEACEEEERMGNSTICEACAGINTEEEPMPSTLPAPPSYPPTAPALRAARPIDPEDEDCDLDECSGPISRIFVSDWATEMLIDEDTDRSVPEDDIRF